MSWSEILHDFVLIFAVVDPIGSVPVFIAVTRRHKDWEKRTIAIQATAVSAGILLFFIVAGQLVLEAIGVPLSAFQMAGGIVLFFFALTMIFGPGKPAEDMEVVRSGKETAIFPMAVPSIASPGAMMAVVLLTDNHRFSIVHQSITALPGDVDCSADHAGLATGFPLGLQADRRLRRQHSQSYHGPDSEFRGGQQCSGRYQNVFHAVTRARFPPINHPHPQAICRGNQY